jgi:hypothetical protein
VPSSQIDPEFEAFKRRLGVQDRCVGQRRVEQLLNRSKRQVARMVANGELKPFRIGALKYSFWEPDIAEILFNSRVLTPDKPEPKPRSSKPIAPPRPVGRPRKGEIRRVG